MRKFGGAVGDIRGGAGSIGADAGGIRTLAGGYEYFSEFDTAEEQAEFEATDPTGWTPTAFAGGIVMRSAGGSNTNESHYMGPIGPGGSVRVRGHYGTNVSGASRQLVYRWYSAAFGLVQGDTVLVNSGTNTAGVPIDVTLALPVGARYFRISSQSQANLFWLWVLEL